MLRLGLVVLGVVGACLFGCRESDRPEPQSTIAPASSLQGIGQELPCLPDKNEVLLYAGAKFCITQLATPSLIFVRLDPADSADALALIESSGEWLRTHGFAWCSPGATYFMQPNKIEMGRTMRLYPTGCDS